MQCYFRAVYLALNDKHTVTQANCCQHLAISCTKHWRSTTFSPPSLQQTSRPWWLRNKPAIILVQGSFQTTLAYDALFTKLQAVGYKVALLPLPSCSDVEHEDFPTQTLIEDAAVMTKTVGGFEEGKTVVVVMHSYGGIIGSEAIPETLSYAARQANMQKGGVILVLLHGILAREGKHSLGDFWRVAKQLRKGTSSHADGRFFIKNGASTIYSDLTSAAATLWESRLIAQSCAVQTTGVTRPAYQYIPSTYLICENGQAIPPQIQEMFAGMAKARVERCDAGHEPTGSIG
ncbi:hypothetical protein BDV09DRAFT_200118 [Aspergillus tetrazonus]